MITYKSLKIGKLYYIESIDYDIDDSPNGIQEIVLLLNKYKDEAGNEMITYLLDKEEISDYFYLAYVSIIKECK